MGKVFALAVVAALSAAALHPSQISEFEPKISKDSIVRVTCETKEGRWVGTASHVGNGQYTTANHVVDKDGTCFVNGQAVYNIRKDVEHDFAMFSGPVLPTRTKFTCRDFRSGRHYMAIGFPGGTTLQVTEAWYASPVSVKKFRVFSGNGYPGMSGGPVIASKSGLMTGVINMRWPTRSIPLRETILCNSKK